MFQIVFTTLQFVLSSCLLLGFLLNTRDANAASSSSTACENESVLIVTTRGNFDIVEYLPSSKSTRIFLEGQLNGLDNPDNIMYKNGYYYISTGTTPENSFIARLNKDTDEFQLDFASGGGLLRPYGFDFYKDVLYVASFMTDQVLMYNASSGAFMGIFTQGNATEEGLCNGPNQIFIHDDGRLYMTTQGSFIDEAGELQFGLQSQTVVYDLVTGGGSVFIPQPEADPNGQGYISMLGIYIACESESLLDDACTIFTTDFAGGLRVYEFSDKPTLLYQQSTTYAEGSSTGSLAIASDGTLYVPGFVGDAGVLMVLTPDLDSSNQNSTNLSILFRGLDRPVGVLNQVCDGKESPSTSWALRRIPLWSSMWIAVIVSVAIKDSF